MSWVVCITPTPQRALTHPFYRIQGKPHRSVQSPPDHFLILYEACPMLMLSCQDAKALDKDILPLLPHHGQSLSL